MSSKSSTVLLLATVAGVLAGLTLGYFVPGLMLSLSFIGQLFINALQIVVIPIIVAGVVVGVAAMADSGRVNRTAGKTLLYFAATGAIAVAVGFVLAFVMQPGSGVSTTGASAPAELTRVTTVSISNVLGSILPGSLGEALGRGQYLWLVLFSIVFGAVLIPVGSKGKPIIDFLQGVNDVMSRFVRALLYAAPLGLLSLVATAIAGNTLSVEKLFGSLGMFSLTVILGLIVQGGIILVLALKFLGNRPVLGYLSATAPALTTAFGTGSPAATLPVTLDCVAGDGDVDERAGAMTLPLGAMINMNGTAVYLVIGAMFCAQAFGVELSILQMVLLAVAAFFLSIGASLIPQGSLLVLGVVLYSADFPIAAYAGIGIIVVADWLFDRLRAVVNVWGDAVGAAVVGDTFDFKTARRVSPSVSSRRQQTPRRTRDSKRREPSRQQSNRPPREKRERKGPGDKDNRQKRERPEKRKHTSDRDSRQPRSRKSESRPPRQREREKPPEEKKSKPFQMPPVPYHVLETELKARKKPETPEVKNSSPAPGDAAPPSEELIERERAKIAAQLDELKQRERSESDARKSAGDAASNGDHDDQAAPAEHNAGGGASFPKVDFYSDDDLASGPAEVQDEEPVKPEVVEQPSRPEPTIESKSEPVSATEEPTEAAPPSEQVSYGRGRTRRGPHPKSGTDGEKAEPTPIESPEYSTDKISFGRGKRKKPSS